MLFICEKSNNFWMALYLVWSNQETSIWWRLIQISITRLFLISSITTTTPATMTKTTTKTTTKKNNKNNVVKPNVVLMFKCICICIFIVPVHSPGIFRRTYGECNKFVNWWVVLLRVNDINLEKCWRYYSCHHVI